MVSLIAIVFPEGIFTTFLLNSLRSTNVNSLVEVTFESITLLKINESKVVPNDSV